MDTTIDRFRQQTGWKAAPAAWMAAHWRDLLVTHAQAVSRAAPIYDQPAECGVYVVLDQHARPVYVGSSVNVNARCRAHESNGDFLDFDAVTIPVPELYLREIEACYIAGVRPMANARNTGTIASEALVEALRAGWRVA